MQHAHVLQCPACDQLAQRGRMGLHLAERSLPAMATQQESWDQARQVMSEWLLP